MLCCEPSEMYVTIFHDHVTYPQILYTVRAKNRTVFRSLYRPNSCTWWRRKVIHIYQTVQTVHFYLEQEIRSVELGVCPMQLFHFWSRDVHSVQNLLLYTKFHENRMIFHWDMAIYRFSEWRPSAILELFYHHTRQRTKSLLLAAAACQISCQSYTQIWRRRGTWKIES